MQLSVTFRHIEPSDALKDYARDKISRVEKYLDSAVEVSVVLSVEKFRHIADVTIMADGLKINGQEQREDMYSAIDLVVDKLERQIKRSRQKIRDHKSGKRSKSKEESLNVNVSDEIEDEEREEDTSDLIRTSKVLAESMDLAEAVRQLDLLPENFLVFTNKANEKINVLRRREAGRYELIEPISE